MKMVREPKDQFYGHRDALCTDPFGYSWGIYTVKEEMSVEEMHRRMQGLTTGPEGGRMPQAKGDRGEVRFRADSAWSRLIWWRRMAMR